MTPTRAGGPQEAGEAARGKWRWRREQEMGIVGEGRQETQLCVGEWVHRSRNRVSEGQGGWN